VSRGALHSNLPDSGRRLLAVYERHFSGGLHSPAQEPGLRDDPAQQVLQLRQLSLLLFPARLVHCRSVTCCLSEPICSGVTFI